MTELLIYTTISFEEFLLTQNSGEYLTKYIKECYEQNKPMDNVMHEKLKDLYRKYLCVGGLPEVVNEFSANGMNILQINRKTIENIILSYINDMNKYVDNKFEAAKNEVIYKSIPVQIGNKSNKFQYTKIEKNARKRDYESSLEWLLASNMIYKCNLLKKRS